MKRVVRLSTTSRASGFNVASILNCNKQQGFNQAIVIWGLHMKRVAAISTCNNDQNIQKVCMHH
jgi:hypothetical protein